jgi:hypothetical protein
MRRTALAVLPLLLLTGCSAGSEVPPGEQASSGVVPPSSPDPQAGAAIDGVQTWSYQPPGHEAVDQTYEQKPPTYGTHWPPRDQQGTWGWLNCGVYDEPVPEEFALHSEEHGAVWLTYRPGASPADVTALAGLRRANTAYVLVSPYPGQPAAFMASTWDAQLQVDRADDPRLLAFVQAYAGGDQGREPGALCSRGSSLEDAKAAVARAPKATSPVPLRPPEGSTSA